MPQSLDAGRVKVPDPVRKSAPRSSVSTLSVLVVLLALTGAEACSVVPIPERAVLSVSVLKGKPITARLNGNIRFASDSLSGPGLNDLLTRAINDGVYTRECVVNKMLLGTQGVVEADVQRQYSGEGDFTVFNENLSLLDVNVTGQKVRLTGRMSTLPTRQLLDQFGTTMQLNLAVVTDYSVTQSNATTQPSMLQKGTHFAIGSSLTHEWTLASAEDTPPQIWMEVK